MWGARLLEMSSTIVSCLMSEMLLNLVVLRSRDLGRAVEFYSALGLSLVPHRHGKGSDHFAAEVGGVVLELYPLAPEGNGSSITTGTRIGFRVPSIDDVLQRLAAFPGSLVSAPKSSEWGLRAVLSDPDGHRVELVQS